VPKESSSTAASQRLRGQCVAVTGRLASLSREEANRLVRAQGGHFSDKVSRETTLLVVGQEGWPLGKDGRLSGNLRRTRVLQEAGHKLQVIGEQEFLERLGLSELASGICGRYTLAQLARVLNVPRTLIAAWLRHRLIEPAGEVEGLPVFDFHQVAAIKALCELRQTGVSTKRLRRSLEQLGQWLPDAQDALLRLSAVEGELLVRDDTGGLTELNGQRRFEFTPLDGDERDGDGARIVKLGPRMSPDAIFYQAVEHEEAGRLDQASELYRRYLHQFGPDAQVCFNLGNVLSALGRHEAAIERFRQAVELNANYVEAWNNLGTTLVEANQREEAIAAFAAALAHAPCYADALYNMADTLEELGRDNEAVRYWRAYLACDSSGPWADYARKRISGRRA
jgi:tetratricopeptide (TPR) repeat protein